MPIQPRNAIKALKPYLPPLEGRREYVRLDFNENTTGFPEVVHELFPGLNPTLLNTYPEYQTFYEQLTHYYKLPSSEWLLLTNGSDEGLAVISSTFIEPKVDLALVSKPTFPLIPHCLQLAEAELIEINVLKTEAGFAYDVATITDALETQPHLKIVFLASPDNPTGATIDPKQVSTWCKAYPNTLFVIDEAYAEFRKPEDSSLNLVQHFENLLVTRSFSKVWGMAGLRLGLIFGHPDLLAFIRRVRSPYSVNTFAVEVGKQMIHKAPEVIEKAQATMQRKETLVAGVIERGYPVLNGAGNFFLMQVGIDSKVLEAFCRNSPVLGQAGILLRDQSRHDLLKGMLRVSVGTPEENQAFLTTLDAFREQSAIIFDLDGTLVDTSGSCDQVVYELVEKYSGSPLTQADLFSLRAEGGYNDDWDSIFEILKRRGVTNIPHEQIAKEGCARYLSIAKQVETPLADFDILKRLGKRYRLFLYTGRMHSEYGPIWGDELYPLLEKAYCRDDFPTLRPKPYPDGLIEIVKYHNLKHAYYIGNSVDDMACGRDASSEVSQGSCLFGRIGVTTNTPSERLTDSGAQIVLDSVQDLPTIFPVV